MKYVCELCGYIYDEVQGEPARGIVPGTAFQDLPGSYECPHCGYGKEAFDPADKGVQTERESTPKHSER